MKRACISSQILGNFPLSVPVAPAFLQLFLPSSSSCCKLNVTALKTRTRLPTRYVLGGLMAGERGARQLNCAKKPVNNGSKTQTTHEQWMANEIEFVRDYIFCSPISQGELFWCKEAQLRSKLWY